MRDGTKTGLCLQAGGFGLKMADPRTSACYPVEVLRDIEAELSEPRFRGVPLGPTLSDLCMIEFYSGRGEWGVTARWKDRARRLRHYLRPLVAQEAAHVIPGRVVITWSSDDFRFSGLVLPVLREFTANECLVLAKVPEVLAHVPAGMQAILAQEAAHYDVRAWRADYRRCRADWQQRTAQALRQTSPATWRLRPHRAPPDALKPVRCRLS